ncbi:MAG: hypothetical protein IJS01_05505 [Lentisphaeria bacterium]|nr:hypothetical protein [Lentisphaeria bacterium]
MNEIITNITHLFQDIKCDFNFLWNFKLRGNTVEIITPFSTLARNTLSVFITQRENRFIVSDGRRLFDNIEENNFEINRRNAVYLDEIASIYEVKKTTENHLYFKSTDNIKLISSYIYDIVFFQKAVFDNIFADEMFFLSEVQDGWFSTRMNNLLSKKIDENKKHNRLFSVPKGHPLMKVAGFNTVLQYQGCATLWAAMYITGSTQGVYADHICRANTGFMYVKNETTLNCQVKLAAIFDEDAKGNDSQYERIKFAKSVMNNSFSFSRYTYLDFNAIDDLSKLYESA